MDPQDDCFSKGEVGWFTHCLALPKKRATKTHGESNGPSNICQANSWISRARWKTLPVHSQQLGHRDLQLGPTVGLMAERSALWRFGNLQSLSVCLWWVMPVPMVCPWGRMLFVLTFLGVVLLVSFAFGLVSQWEQWQILLKEGGDSINC